MRLLKLFIGLFLSAALLVPFGAHSAQQVVRRPITSSAPATAVVGHSLLYTGNGGTNTVTGAEVAPDIVIQRDRAGGAGTQWHEANTTTGTGKYMIPSTNGPETSDANSLTAFNSNGFTLGNATTWNNNTKTYVALVLKKTTNALDIVSYTGNGSAGRTVAHSLGVVPELMIVKSHAAFSRNWAVYASSQGNTKAANLDSTNGFSVLNYWNNTTPTSSVFTVSNATQTNENGQPYIAFLFATNSNVKVGSYTGDGNANGAFQTTNFQVRFVIIKRTDTTGSWYVFEDQADASSPHNKYNVITGGAVAEATTTNTAGGVDMTSTGWQCIDCAPADINVNTATYIYLAVG